MLGIGEKERKERVKILKEDRLQAESPSGGLTFSGTAGCSRPLSCSAEHIIINKSQTMNNSKESKGIVGSYEMTFQLFQVRTVEVVQTG